MHERGEGEDRHRCRTVPVTSLIEPLKICRCQLHKGNIPDDGLRRVPQAALTRNMIELPPLLRLSTGFDGYAAVFFLWSER